MERTRDSIGEWGCVAILSLIGLALSAVARLGFGYPWCTDGNDETFWAVILEARTQGFHYPISGLFFVELLGWLVPQIGLSFSSGISWFGMLSVPALIAVAAVFYRRALPELFWPVFAALALTAYFWAPLIESKPQQWGQWGALICGWLLCRNLVGGRSWVAFALGATTVAFLHILSFGILFAITGWVWLFYLLLGRTSVVAGVRAALCFVPGLAVLLWPNGPYAISVDVILHDHITDANAMRALAGAVVAVALLALVLALRRRSHDAVSVRVVKFGRPIVFWGLLLTSTACLAVQAALLPTHYWQFYDYSSGRFLLSQAGNVLFAVFVLQGAAQLVEDWSKGVLSAAMQHFAALGLATALTAGLALLITLWTIDTNWLLRVMSYLALFAAPLAARSLLLAYRARPRLTSAICGGAALVSVLSSLRWSGLIDCGL